MVPPRPSPLPNVNVKTLTTRAIPKVQFTPLTSTLNLNLEPEP